VLVLWAARCWLQRRPRFLWPPICWAVLAFVAYAIGRYLTADIEYVARQELIRVLVYAALFLAILNNLHGQEVTQVISYVLIFLAMAISFYAIFQVLTNSSRVWFTPTLYPHRGSGTYVCPNHLGGFLELLLPLGLAYTLTSRLKPLLKVFLGYASLAILAGIAATFSRGSWASVAVSLLFFFAVLAFHRTHRLPSLLLLVLILGSGIIFVSRSFTFQMRLKQTGVPSRIEEDTRLALWQSAVRIWHENVWWGVGPAHYDSRFRQYRPGEVQQRPAWSHNDILNTLTDWGIAGTALVTAAWVLLGLGVYQTWPFVRSSASDLGSKKGSNKFAFVLGASAGLLAILVHSTFDFNMHIPANAILAITLMALLSSHLRFATESYWFRLAVWGRLLVSALLLAWAAYLGDQGWRHSNETLCLRRAAAAPNFSPARIEWLKKAFAIEPKNSETAYSIGEAYRIQSGEGGQDYRALAQQAMEWFQRTMDLNRWGGYGFLGYGWCLDWLDRSAESQPYFDRAAELDPNGYYTLDYVGLHYVQLQDYAAAKPWFERSLNLQWADNMIAQNYLQIIHRRMLESATNQNSGRLGQPLPAQR
jgi:O-antigen ligase